MAGVHSPVTTSVSSMSTRKETAPTEIPFSRLLFDQGAINQAVIDHPYPGSGTADDPYVITWIPGDPRNPQLLSEPFKWLLTVLISLAALAAALVSSAYSGGIIEIIEYFHFSKVVAYVGISLYVLGFALGPLIWAPLSEIYGRRWIYIISMVFFTAFTAATAGVTNTESLLILRFLAGSMGSSGMALPGGVIADIFPATTRGLAMGMFATAPFLGPTLGPIIGGFISENIGWRWVEGVLAIFTAVLVTGLIFLLPETYAPVLLQARAQRLQQITGNRYRSASDKSSISLYKTLGTALSRPWLFLFSEPIVFLLCLYVAIVYGILYLQFAAYPIVFQQARGWSESIGGLSFLGILVGILLAAAYMFPVYFQYKKKTLASPTGRLPPEERLRSTFIGAIALPVGLFWFAWTNSPSVHWMSSIAAGVPFGFGMPLVFLPVSNYLVDTYTIYAASVVAANTLLRSTFGAAFPLFTGYMFEDLGIHWGASVPAFLALACAPIPFLLYRFGSRIRRRSKYASEAEAFMQRLLGNTQVETTQQQQQQQQQQKQQMEGGKESV
ncbi:hypothetical protein ASPSYDRAFT_39759 [Aspergillus sydowii CBS 593.65]|uniref:Major facilitator superfamily (MFS) profile domain-containing protein n=1 Tax=Aspergillus sydowii CBS 593.65 TaxID=1036612 RepID=A0A1L9TZU2_9EURO|nr:uncharacterized protein ASPSYDRAFT_39759 [Aspergillus sydowii CBS 593.65]OJJ64970.1 hypothetical protein ASPSYDRAFT_39759 [Aspergillus sydowii CBS 593.65]